VSRASLEDAERRWGGAPHPPFVVQAGLFGDAPGEGSQAISFPFLTRAVLTDDPVDEATVNAARAHKTQFQESADGILFAVIGVRAQVGSRAEFEWCVTPGSSSVTFDRQVEFSSWSGKSRRRFVTGHHHVTIRINGVRWSTLPFEVVP
jgi:hypothetical protein